MSRKQDQGREGYRLTEMGLVRHDRQDPHLYPTTLPLRRLSRPFDLPTDPRSSHPPDLFQATQPPAAPFRRPPLDRVRSQPLRDPHSQVFGTVCRARRRAILCVSVVLCGVVVFGRVLEVQFVYGLHVGRFRVHHRIPGECLRL